MRKNTFPLMLLLSLNTLAVAQENPKTVHSNIGSLRLFDVDNAARATLTVLQEAKVTYAYD